MSTLTKLFVILLVILSVALTSATVVFVNRVDNFKVLKEGLEAKAAAMEARASAASAESLKAKADQQAALQANQAALAAKDQTLLSVQQQLAQRDTEIASLKGSNSMAAANLAQVTEALKTSELTKSRTLEANVAFRGDLDKLIGQNAQLNAAVSDLTNRLEVTERERRYFQEQLAESQSQASRYSATLKDMGATAPNQITGGLTAGAPAITGVVRATRTIASIPYATISVGTSDAVVRGMQFKILDANTGDFLGVITVDTVEANESTGRVSGPRINDIRSGNEVRTQL